MLDCGDLRSYAQFGFGSHFIVTKKREDCEHIHHRYLAILLLCPAFSILVTGAGAGDTFTDKTS